MDTKLYIITGASGTGKSTSALLLKKKLPVSYLVYDYDEILRPFDHTETWGDEVTEKMLNIAKENSEKYIITVVLGLIRPYTVKKHQEKYGVKSIKFCLLDITSEERAKRLAIRGSSMSLVDGIEEHVGFRSWIHEAGYESIVINVTALSPDEVTEKIQEWVLSS
jgi:broad-specificity NMP kinase